MNVNRRQFVAGALAAGTLSLAAARKRACMKGALLHLGSNMWGDFLFDPDADNGNYRAFVYAQDACWRETVDNAAKAGLNLVVVDLGEAVTFPSHPELAVKGSWSVEKFRAELARMRRLGLEPIPKLNFSAGHDPWLKWYSRMLSTSQYYKVCEEIIADVVEIFDKPRYFHIGFDEECAQTQRKRALCNYRQGDLWWHDLDKIAGFCLRRGARPVMFADKMWWGRKEFFAKMSKDIVQSPWYYFDDFSKENLTWDYTFETSGAWPHKRHGSATILALYEAGFDQIACCSNCYSATSVDSFVKYCSANLVGTEHFLGMYVAPWGMSVPGRMYEGEEAKANRLRGCGTALTNEGLAQFGDALRRYGC